nr:DinB family protein [Evansella tamaricis]
MEKTRQKLIEEFVHLSEEELNWKPDNSSWSIAQIVHHLELSEVVFTKAIGYGLKKQSDEGGLKAKKIEYVLDRSRKVAAPEMVLPSDKPFRVEELVDQLSKSRKQFFSVIAKLDSKDTLYQRSVKHPIFGDLPLVQWVELLFLHEQRHIQQMKEIKEMIEGTLKA